MSRSWNRAVAPSKLLCPLCSTQAAPERLKKRPLQRPRKSEMKRSVDRAEASPFVIFALQRIGSGRFSVGSSAPLCFKPPVLRSKTSKREQRFLMQTIICGHLLRCALPLSYGFSALSSLLRTLKTYFTQ
ncbi:hypothetical protein L596_027414 [Steinernema carpocapsae]|uniref:Uncharacterized protein n=1 Tax=Steinernema carpocapsae TaxID=34508 RepID=A0A4U5M4A6_STECR|nr:hypothetical protein L596_027414 [Steinernema carpocapsae]